MNKWIAVIEMLVILDR